MRTVSVIGPRRPLSAPISAELRRRSDVAEVGMADTVGVADTVVLIAGTDAEQWFDSPQAAAEATVRQTRRVLDQADEAKVESLVHISSAVVYGAWPDNAVPLPEDAALRPNPGFAFAHAHAEAERLVAEWADDHPDAQVAVLRPAIIMGGDGPSWMARIVGGIRSPRAGGEGRPLQFVHADDVASAIDTVLTHGLTGTFNVAPDGWVDEDTARQLAGGVARVALPPRLAHAVGRLIFRWRRSGVPKAAEPWTLHPWVVANDRLRQAGWNPAFTNEEAFVVTEPDPPLERVTAGRRQELILAITGAAGAGLVTAVVLLLRRSGRGRRDG
jgi:nucleoside-diphosphate-sugar epimerase